MRPDDRKRVAHTIDACEEIERFLGGRMPEELESNDYFDVDPEIVWQTAAEEVPATLPVLRRLLEELS